MTFAEETTRRTPARPRPLPSFAKKGLRRIRSQDPGDILRLNASQTRRGLLRRGVFGRSGVGYGIVGFLRRPGRILRGTESGHM